MGAGTAPPAEAPELRCEYAPCGKPLVQTPGKRRRRFCNNAHRAAAWQLARGGRAVPPVPSAIGSDHVRALHEGISALRVQADRLVQVLVDVAPGSSSNAECGDDESDELRKECARLQRRIIELEIHLESERRNASFLLEEVLPKRIEEAIRDYQQQEREKRFERATKRRVAERERARRKNK